MKDLGVGLILINCGLGHFPLPARINVLYAMWQPSLKSFIERRPSLVHLLNSRRMQVIPIMIGDRVIVTKLNRVLTVNLIT